MEALYVAKKEWEDILEHKCGECDNWGQRRSWAYTWWPTFVASNAKKLYVGNPKRIIKNPKVRGREIHSWEGQSHERGLVKKVCPECLYIWLCCQPQAIQGGSMFWMFFQVLKSKCCGSGAKLKIRQFNSGCSLGKKWTLKRAALQCSGVLKQKIFFDFF